MSMGPARVAVWIRDPAPAAAPITTTSRLPSRRLGAEIFCKPSYFSSPAFSSLHCIVIASTINKYIGWWSFPPRVSTVFIVFCTILTQLLCLIRALFPPQISSIFPSNFPHFSTQYVWKLVLHFWVFFCSSYFFILWFSQCCCFITSGFMMASIVVYSIDFCVLQNYLAYQNKIHS